MKRHRCAAQRSCPKTIVNAFLSGSSASENGIQTAAPAPSYRPKIGFVPIYLSERAVQFVRANSRVLLDPEMAFPCPDGTGSFVTPVREQQNEQKEKIKFHNFIPTEVRAWTFRSSGDQNGNIG
jgi:hypothetical protein